MAKVSLREAVKKFDVSRPTLQKALKIGKVSGEQDARKQWTIDTAELARVYRPRDAAAVKPEKDVPGNFTAENSPLQGKVQEMEKALADAEKRAEIAEALAQERAERIEDLRRMLPAPDAKPRRWWPW